jgi:transcriptional regulator with XRE-family HTH domain
VTSKYARTFKDELARRGLERDQAAVLAGVQPSTISRIINGKVRARPATVVAMARALGIGASRMRDMMEADYLAANPAEDLAADEVA